MEKSISIIRHILNVTIVQLIQCHLISLTVLSVQKVEFVMEELVLKLKMVIGDHII